VAAAEIAHSAVIRLLIAGQHAEDYFFPSGTLNFACAWHPDGVGVEEEHDHHSRVVSFFSVWIFRQALCTDLLKINLSGQIQQEEH
jgi:hypothetical protein